MTKYGIVSPRGIYFAVAGTLMLLVPILCFLPIISEFRVRNKAVIGLRKRGFEIVAVPTGLVSRFTPYFDRIVEAYAPNDGHTSGECLAYIGKLTQLKTLYISGQNVTDSNIMHIARLSDLRELRITDSGITDESFKILIKLNKLESLYILDNKMLTSKCCSHISRLTNLKNLVVNYCNLEGLDFHWLARMAQLERLEIRHANLTNGDFEHINDMKRIKHLDIGYNQVDDNLSQKIRLMQNLEYLFMDNTGLTDRGLMDFTSLLMMKQLDVRRTHVSPDGWRIAQECLPRTIVWHDEQWEEEIPKK